MGGDALSTADSTALHGGVATASATATGGAPGGGSSLPAAPGAANATSTATTDHGALAQALSTETGSVTNQSGGAPSAAQSTAKTSFAGASVTSTAVASSFFNDGTATTNAIAQGGSGQDLVNPGQTAYAFSTVLPDKAYATTLIDGASNVADALLGPRDKVLGIAILGANNGEESGEASSTFDFRFRGDLLLGLIEGSGEFSISANSVEIHSESFDADDSVINLGYNFGPNIDLTFSGSGVFAVGGAFPGSAVPETSTWAMMLLGFAGLGFAGYRASRRSDGRHPFASARMTSL